MLRSVTQRQQIFNFQIARSPCLKWACRCRLRAVAVVQLTRLSYLH